ncbi:O-antigen ligase family protein [Lacticaseibacillus suihuaensis]
MLKVLFIATMTVAFTLKFNGSQISYTLQIAAGLVWLAVAGGRLALQNLLAKRRFTVSRLLVWMLVPWVLIFLWPLILWGFWPPQLVDASYYARFFNNATLILVAILAAYLAAATFGGDNALHLSFYALGAAILVNLLVVVPQFDWRTLAAYPLNVLRGDYVWQSPLWNLADKLETQGPTMTAGLFFLYFLWFDRDDAAQKRWLLVAAATVALLIGFKRTAVVGLLLATAAVWLLSRKRLRLTTAIAILAGGAIVLLGGYVFLLDSGALTPISAFLHLDMMGRAGIYSTLVQLFSFDPLFAGLGFTYVAKTMYDTIQFEAHSEIVRMYAELGFFPFFAWLGYELAWLPTALLRHVDRRAARLFLVAVIYVFGTYLTENTLMVFSMQFGLAAFAFASLQPSAPALEVAA